VSAKRGSLSGTPHFRIEDSCHFTQAQAPGRSRVTTTRAAKGDMVTRFDWRPICSGIGVAQRQENDETGAASGFALDGNDSAVLFDDAAGDWQTEAGAGAFGREKG